MLPDAAPVKVASIRNANDPPARDINAGFASGSGRDGFFDPDGTSVLRASSPQSSGKEEQYRTVIGDLLAEQDIILGMPAKGRRSALARVAARLGEKVCLKHGAVLAAMLRRERLGSTAIGSGVAIPHARLEGIPGPKAVLATLQHPIWFDAPDEKPVDLLLAIIWPKADTAGFLQALAHFCRVLRQAELRDRIRTAETPAEVLAWIAATAA
jgi:PTS system nitrogen regulatory IIA component